MTTRAAVSAIIVATWTLGACGVSSPDAGSTHAAQDTPRLLVDLQSLPDGHPPVPGVPPRPALPEGHPPVPGFHSLPALPDGHPRCPASGSHGMTPSGPGPAPVLQNPPEWISI